MTNDYTALVAMLDQAAADLQAEIDAAIDRHGLLVRTANQLRAEADGPSVAAEPVAILSVHERCTQEQRDALKQRLASDNRWQYVIDPANNTDGMGIAIPGKPWYITGIDEVDEVLRAYRHRSGPRSVRVGWLT